MLTINNIGIVCFGLLIISEWLIIKIKSSLFRPFVYLQIVLLIFISFFVFFSFYGLTFLVPLISIYRIINLTYYLKTNHLKNDYSSRLTKSSLVLGLVQFIVILLQVIYESNLTTFVNLTVIFSAVVFVVLVFLSVVIYRKTNHLKPAKVSVHYYDKDLPTVSVLIPAKDESDDLVNCLTSLTRSDYPKLEIIVLDDCSQTKQTSDIIKSFAHQGVVFIEGQTPPDNWLAKNFAYHQLLQQSNGEILLFCGVDVEFSSHSIRSMVELMLSRKNNMMSIIPKSNFDKHNLFINFDYQLLRYNFEIMFSQLLLHRPSSLSTCWLIDRSSLMHNNGFQDLKLNLLPEKKLAQNLIDQKLSYSFYESNKFIGLTTTKSINDQESTALRISYPKMLQRIDIVFVFSLFLFVVFIGPILILISDLVLGNYLILVLSLLNIILVVYYFDQLLKICYHHLFRLTGIFYPVLIFKEIIIYHQSMWHYLFGEVYWKNRNICLPPKDYNQPNQIDL